MVLTALKHLCRIARNILNNPGEHEPRKVFKSDDEVLVEELFVLPEAADLLRAMGFREEPDYFYFDPETSDELADVFEVLSRCRDHSAQPQLVPQSAPRVVSKADEKKLKEEAERLRIKEQMRLDRLEKQKDIEYEAIRSRHLQSSQPQQQQPKPQTPAAVGAEQDRPATVISEKPPVLKLYQPKTK